MEGPDDCLLAETPAIMRGHKWFYSEKVLLVTALKNDCWEKLDEVMHIKLEDLDECEQITEAEYLGILLQCQKR